MIKSKTKWGTDVKKRILSAVLSVCLAALCCTGCGNDITDSGISKTEQTTTESSAPETTTTQQDSALEASGSLSTSETTTNEQTTTTTSESSETTTTTSESSETTTTTSQSTTTTTTSQTTTTAAQATTASQATTAAKNTSAASKPATTAAQTTTKPSATQPVNVTTKAQAASSSNVKFYQDRVYVAGDSIAYGFCAYGYIPYDHNIAQGSLAMRNHTSYGWFNVNGRQMRCLEAVFAKQPRLLYVSMGMNDVNLTSAQTYASNYVSFLRQVRAKLPNCIIVAANITPIASSSGFTSIYNIRNSNVAMQNAVKAMNDPNIILFDAYSVVSAGGTYMANGYSAGDGIHLQGHVYQKLLNRLAVVLDSYGVKERLS